MINNFGGGSFGTNKIGLPIRQGANPQWLYDGNRYRMLCGPGDPEGFLYLGTKGGDGTRSGGAQQAIIDAYVANGSNTLYAQTMRTPGDGGTDETPLVGDVDGGAMDQDILDQWEGWFTQLETAGVFIFLFMFDDHQGAAEFFGTGDTVPANENTYLTTLVNEFKHHKNIIWMIGEEYSEGFSAARCTAQAVVMRAASADILIGNHQLNGTTFDFQTDANIRLFGIQQNVALASVNSGVAGISADAVTDGYAYAYLENINHGTGANARKIDWAAVMGGACAVTRLFTEAADSSEAGIGTATSAEFADMQRLIDFFESTSFHTMRPDNALINSGTDYLLADAGNDYIAYAENLTSTIGILSMTSGTYNLTWQACDADETVLETSVSVDNGTNTFTKPGGITGTELAVWLERQ